MLTKRKTLRQDNYKLAVLLAAGSLTTLAGGVVAPVLPDVVQALNIDPVLAGNLVSFHCLTIALFSPPLGILADRIGPLRILIPSLILYALFGCAGALMFSFWPLLVTRGLLGAASGGIAAASLGLIGRMYEGEARSRVMGYATSTLTITGIAFPILGGLVGATNWRLAFLLYALGLPLAFLAQRLFPSKPQKRKSSSPKGMGKELTQVLGHPKTVQLLLTLGLASVAMYAVIIYAPIYLRETIEAGAVLNGVVLASRALGAALISAFGAKQIAQTLGTTKAIALGFVLMTLTLISIPFLYQVYWIVGAAVIFGLGFGISLPNLYNSLASLSPKELRSSILAAGTGAGFLGQFLSPILLGPVLDWGGLPWVFYTAAGVAFVSGLLLFTPKDWLVMSSER